jgi:hypothetical protein
MILTHLFLLFPRRILSTQSLYKMKMFSLLNHYYNNVSQMCNLCSVFHSLNVWHSYLTSSSVCSYVCDCQFCNYGCPMYLVIQSFCSSTVSNNTYVWLGISLIPKTNIIYVSNGILWTCSISQTCNCFCGSMER